MMRIVALLTVYNEECYLHTCLTHLVREGLEVCLIDNDSTDRSREIAESFLGRGVIRIERLPRRGMFELEPILKNEEDLAMDIGADWYLHHDADEIRQAPAPFRSLREGIEAVDRAGFNAINFDEFVFVPTTDSDDFTGRYPDEMEYYYFFEPSKQRRINAWKHTGDRVDLHSSGGHAVSFPGREVYERNFILRHYIGLSRAHVVRKYCGRVVSEEERTTLGWNNARASLRPDQLRLPDRSRLKRLSSDNTWDRNDPWTRHAVFEHSPLLPRETIASFEEETSESPLAVIVGMAGSGLDVLVEVLRGHPTLSVGRTAVPIGRILSELDAGSDKLAAFLDAASAYCSQETVERVHARARREDLSLSDGIRELLRAENGLSADAGWVIEIPHATADLEVIRNALPQARFIHLIRDGRDVYSSSTPTVPRNPETEASQWIWSIAQARRQAQHLPHYLEVRFEDLAERPYEGVERIFAFLGVDLVESQMTEILPILESAKSAAPRIEMTDLEREQFQRVAGSMLAELGYELST